MQISRKNVNSQSFKATPAEIKAALKAGDKICPGKTGYLTNQFLPKLGLVTDTLTLNLNSEIKSTANKKSPLGVLVSWLNENSIFRCSDTSSCTCGQNMKNRDFLAQIFKKLDLNNPDKLELNKTI